MLTRSSKPIKPRLQLRMVAVFVALACVSGCFQLILVNRSIVELLQAQDVGAEALTERLPLTMTENLLWTVALLVPLMGYVGLIVTQRIAGPIHVFERYIDRYLAGESVGACRLRKGDELHGLAVRLTALVEHAQQAVESKSGEAVEGQSPGSDPALERAA
jgi:hypothetical protein